MGIKTGIMKQLFTLLLAALLLNFTPSAIGQKQFSERKTQSDEIALTKSKNQNSEDKLKVKGNFPNPVQEKTKFVFTIKKSMKVEVNVYDLLGNKVKNVLKDNLDQGEHKVDYNAGNLKPGIYFYSIKAGNLKIINRFNKVR